MTFPLRRMNLLEILDRTVHIFRERFLAFVLIAAIPVLAIEIIYKVGVDLLHVQSLFGSDRQSGAFIWNILVNHCFYYLAIILAMLATPAAIKLVSVSILGTRSTIVSLLQFAAAQWRRYVWTAFLLVLACLVIPECCLAAASFGIEFVEKAVGLLSWKSGWFVPSSDPAFKIGLGVAVFWLGACLSLAIPAAALEDLAGINSLRRSLHLSRGSRTRIWLVMLGIYLALWAITLGMEFLLGQLLYLTGSVLHIADAMRQLYVPAVFVLANIIYLVLLPIYPIAITLFYYDQRIRREGYDIERLMESAGMTADLTPPAGEGIVAPAVAEETPS